MRAWKERLDPEKHRDFMLGFQDAGGAPRDVPADNLRMEWVYFVAVPGFTFQFASLAQLDQAIAYFSEKTHRSSRRPDVGVEHYWQRWFERLPPGLNRGAKRVRVLGSLKKAASEFSEQGGLDA